MATIKINNTTFTFSNVYYVSPTGNNTTGNGSQASPYLTIAKAVSVCSSNGDAVYALAGTYDVTTINGAYTSGGLDDLGKSISFFGVPNQTIFLSDGFAHANRDTHAIMTRGTGTRIFNIVFDYRLGNRTDNYSISVFGYDSAKICAELYNCLIKCTSAPSMIYDNSNTSVVKLTNCSFSVGGNILSSYSAGSRVTLINCSNNRAFASEGTRTTCLTNVTYNEFYYITSSGWLNSGTGNNLDNSTANIGLYGGIYAWTMIFYLLQDGSAFKTIAQNSGNLVLNTVGAVGTTTLNSTFFKSNGFNDLTWLTSNTISSISSSFTLLACNPNSTSAFTPTLSAAPFDQLMLQTQDISYTGRLESFTISETVSGDAIVKIIASGDSGATWKSWNAATSLWDEVTTLTPAAVLSAGMISTTLNALTRANWEALGDTYRFGYAFSYTSDSDVAKINAITAATSQATASPSVSSLSVSYTQIDPLYYGLIFTDLAGDVYTTSDGTIVKYLDFGTIVADTSTPETAVKLRNGYNFSVNNIVITKGPSPDGGTLEFSKSNSPFVGASSLTYTETLAPNEEITLYVRVSAARTAVSGGIFNLKVKASVVA